MASTGDDHFSRTEDETNDLRVVESIDKAWELLGLVLHLVEGQVEGEVVEIEFARHAGLWFAGELVHAVVVFRVVKGVGGHHVLDFNGDILEVPRLDASSTQILDHAVNTGVDVVLVLSTGAHGTAGAEHEDGQFWLRDTVDDTGELLGLVLAVELDGNVGEVEFFSDTGAGNYVNDGKAFFIGGHIKAERHLVYKRNFGASHVPLPKSFEAELLSTLFNSNAFVADARDERSPARQFDGLAGLLGVPCERDHAAAATRTGQFDTQRGRHGGLNQGFKFR